MIGCLRGCLLETRCHRQSFLAREEGGRKDGGRVECVACLALLIDLWLWLLELLSRWI